MVTYFSLCMRIEFTHVEYASKIYNELILSVYDCFYENS